MSAPLHRNSRVPLVFAALALGVLAAAVRVGWGGEPARASGWVAISDPDAAYHLRRAERIGAGFWTLAIFDPFLDAPVGAVVPWPPLWDLTLAGALRLAPSDPASGFVRPAVALLPPLVAALGVLALFALARRLSSGHLELAAGAAGIAALVAADRPWTGFGRLDHSAAELALWCAIAAALARALDQAPRPGVLDRRALLPALALAAGLATQAALLPAAALPFLAALVLPNEARRTMPRFLASFWGATALLLLPVSWVYTAAGAPIAHTHFGHFQPALLASAALGAAALALAMASAGRRLLLAIPSAALSLAGLFLLTPELLAGLGFVGRSSTWIATIGESRSPFAGGVAAGLRFALGELSLLVVLLPLAFVALFRRSRSGDGAASVALAALAVGTLLASAQARFAGYLGMLVGVAAVTALARWLARLAPAFRGVALVALLALVVLPQLARRPAPELSARALERSFDLLGDLRRRAQGFPEGERGVVLAEWSFGHFVQYYGRHPAAVDNFGDFLGDLSLPRRVLLAEDEATAEAAMAERSVRYLFVGPLAETLSGLLASEEQRARYVAASRLAPDGTLAVDFRPPIVRTVLYRTARQLGTAVASVSEGLVPPLRSLRLVAGSAAVETLPDGRRLPQYKLFERVRGARLRSSGWRPGEEVALEGRMLTPSGIEFPWFDVGRADADGVVELRFPYWSQPADGARPLVLELGAGERRVPVQAISEAAVRGGAVVDLAPAPAGAVVELAPAPAGA